MAGLQCSRRLWLTVHEPPDWTKAESGSVKEIGTKIGEKAHLLFPGGILIEELPWQHAEAVARTNAFMSDKSVTAIFEAAFEHGGLRIRVDVLERLPRGRWGLREVKSSSSVKQHYLDDIAVQVRVLQEIGIKLGSVELIHIDNEYVRGKRGVSWQKLFKRVEIKAETANILCSVPDRICELMTCLRKRKEPRIEPSSHCWSPNPCEFYDRCVADKPEDWVAYMPRIKETHLTSLRDSGIESIAAIPEDFPLSHQQRIIRDVLATGRTFVSPDLGRLLETFSPPAFYLDFETVGPALPLYAGTRPFQPIPFQWSLHRLDAKGNLSHQEFLADGKADSRREFVETLLKALGKSKAPIIVYSSFEQTQLKTLAAEFEDLHEAITAVIARLRDLLPIVRGAVYHADFQFSHSIKAVAPALCPDFGYSDLDHVADGQAASNAFNQLASADLDAATALELRQALLAYCCRDTLAMVEVHRALVKLAAKGDA